MKGQYIFSRLAQRDLAVIADYIKRDNPSAALRWINRLENQCQKLAELPRLGRIYDALGSKLRGFPVGRYMVFYCEQEAGILVVRVLHMSRDIKPLLQ